MDFITIWLKSKSIIGRCQPRLDNLHKVYEEPINKMATPERLIPSTWARRIADYVSFDKNKCFEK